MRGIKNLQLNHHPLLSVTSNFSTQHPSYLPSLHDPEFQLQIIHPHPPLLLFKFKGNQSFSKKKMSVERILGR